MQVAHSQKASQIVTHDEAAQAAASAVAQAFDTAPTLQAVKKQLSQPLADTSLGVNRQNDSDLPDSRLAADAHNGTVRQQHEPAQPKQAACAFLPDSASQGPPAPRSAVDQTLLPQTTADASAANTPCTDSLKLARSASLLYDSQQAIVPDRCEQTPLPAEPLPV